MDVSSNYLHMETEAEATGRAVALEQQVTSEKMADHFLLGASVSVRVSWVR